MALKNKYQRQKEQYSTDGGITWLDVAPPNYRKGNVIEMGSDDCNTIEWIEVAGSWFCIGTDTVTRWVIATNEYMCSNGNKYQKEKEQISYDNGVTWSDTGNARNGSLIEADSEDCNYANQYLTFVALEDGTFSFTGTSTNSLSYTLDDGQTWIPLASGVASPIVTTGNKIMWKGITTPNISRYEGIGRFSSTGRFNTYGNIMSIVYGDNFEEQTVIDDYQFRILFNASKVVNAENLVLPSTILKNECYVSMFGTCTYLTTAPELPATTLAKSCYVYMFGECTSLVNAPELPATTLAQSCYSSMFYGCTDLTSAPDLTATILTDRCYYNMFSNCSNLNFIKCLATDITANNCTYLWLLNTSSSGTFVKSSGTSWATGASSIPSGWTVQTASE